MQPAMKWSTNATKAHLTCHIMIRYVTDMNHWRASWDRKWFCKWIHTRIIDSWWEKLFIVSLCVSVQRLMIETYPFANLANLYNHLLRTRYCVRTIVWADFQVSVSRYGIVNFRLCEVLSSSKAELHDVYHFLYAPSHNKMLAHNT